MRIVAENDTHCDDDNRDIVNGRRCARAGDARALLGQWRSAVSEHGMWRERRAGAGTAGAADR
jgi:hypothetical protein